MIFFKALIICLLFICIKANFCCKNDKGECVDRWTIYKPPLKFSPNEFYYLDDQQIRNKILAMKLFKDIESTNNNPFYNTIAQADFFTALNHDKVFIIIFNDQKGGKSKSNRAHMKGFILFRDGQGVYVQHSVPDLTGKEYPYSGLENGQHMVCWTIDEKNLNKIGRHLYYTHPEIITKEVSGYFLKKKSDKYLKHIASNEFEEKPVIFDDLEFFTVGKFKVDVFSVNNKQQQQLWYSIIKYKEEFNMVTWRRNNLLTGKTLLKNVREIFMDVNKKKDDCWSIKKEHSKYALSTSGNRICFGDVNFESAKEDKKTGKRRFRGGGLYCFEEEILVNDLRKKLSFTPTGDNGICDKKGEPR